VRKLYLDAVEERDGYSEQEPPQLSC